MTKPRIKPDLAFMSSHPAHVFALGFGSGLAPAAPGTWGTLAAIPCWLLIATAPFAMQVAIVAAGFFLGVWICQLTSNNLGVHDHGSIVWDEFIGLWIVLLVTPAGWGWLLLAFLLFRFFDIVKPWPIKYLDQKVHGGFGIMLDDAIAGILSSAVLLAIASAI